MAEQSLDFEISSAAALADPWQFLEPLREREPIFWSEIEQAWMVTRHADFKAGHRDVKRLSSDRVSLYLRDDPTLARICPTVAGSIPRNLSFSDAPYHTRVRGVMNKPFTTPNVERVRDQARVIIADLMDECEAAGELDFVPIASELPSRLVLEMFGIPLEYKEDMKLMAQALTLALGASHVTEDLMRAFEESTCKVFAIVNELADEVEARPRDDFLTAMVHAQDEGRRMTRRELLDSVYAVMSAGFDTTAAATSVFLRKIAEDPKLTDYVRSHPERIDAVVKELLRYPGLVKAQHRLASTDFEWQGKNIRKGDQVYFWHFAANTDPRVFDRPYEIDVTRDTSQAVSFGHGIHFCIGNLLAKMELAEFMTAAFNRFDVEVTQKTFNHVPGYAIHGYREMATRFTPRAKAARAA